MTIKEPPKIELSQEELSSLRHRIKSNKLDSKDITTLVAILDLFVWMKNALIHKKLSVLFWLRRMFGLKTEKDPKKTSSDSEKKNGESKKGHGRNGREDYPGAPKVEVSHPDLKPGDECPECHEGKLKEDKPAVDYDWQGSPPVYLTIYLLQRLLCPICKVSFTAPSPVAETAKTVDDSTDDKKVTKANRNAMANAVVACLRYMFGIATYRLAKIQGRMGMALPESTQYEMISQVYDAGVPVYNELILRAAQRGLLHADDTAIKILDWLAGKGPPTKTTKTPRKTAQTSAIVSKSAEGRDIVLYMTGAKMAGANMKEVLDLRRLESETPIYMCDGLSANRPGSHAVIQVHCLDHARRQFFDIQSAYPKEWGHVQKLLAKVYKADKEAKNQRLNPAQRLEYHKEHSKDPMEKLGAWLQDQIKTEKAEENSPLGKAIMYCLKRWSELTEFLHTEGVPLSNAEAERAIKLIIPHRKNSLFYKTENGARTGDIIQSLIATCQASGVNCFQYLEWLQKNKSKVKQAPQDFLPWEMPQP